MSDLQNLTPANTYKGLLQVGDYTNGVDSTVRSVLDGEGTASALAISTTKVGIGTTSPTQELEVSGDIVSTTLTTSGAVTAGSVSTSGAVGAGSIDVGGNVVADEYALDQVGSSSSAVAIHAPATNELAIRTNSAERLRVDSSGNFGIGTTNPTSSLHIQNTATNLINLTKDANVLGSSSGEAAEIHGGALASTSPSMGGAIGFEIKDSDGSGSATDTEGEIYFKTKVSGSSLTEKMRIDSDGNVGIGTASPDSTLHLQADDVLLKIRDTEAHSSTSGPEINLQGKNSSGVVKSLSSIKAYSTDTDKGSIAFNVRQSFTQTDEEAMRIDSDGNVGIGTTSPSAPLDVTSTTGGVIMPRMTTTQMNAISSPTDGEMIYNTTANKFYGRANGAWTPLH